MSVPAPIPPVITPHEYSADAPVPISEVVTFRAGPVSCDGDTITPVRIEHPFPRTNIRFAPAASASPSSYQLTFAIGADGRPRAIAVKGFSPHAYDTSDLAPSLAASRFARGERLRCSITYTRMSVPIATAPSALLYETASMPSSGPASGELFDRARGPGSDCGSGPEAPLRLNYPAFDKIEQEPATRSWTFLGFDVDARGRPRNVRVLGSAGRSQLDRAGVQAVSANRYSPGTPRRGCVFYFFRNGPGLLAPELPANTPRESGALADCEIDRKTISGLVGGGAFPSAFLQRKIEGVVAVRYETAAWGGIGNIEILASEPAEAFGDAARTALSNAKVAVSDTGHRGCITWVRFKLPETAGPPTNRPK